MELHDINLREPDPAQERAPGKKPYQKPEMTYLAPLEAMAVVCVEPGKASASCSFTMS
jgi:hypothetical protein